MERVPEPELMEAEDQVRAYAEADFSDPHDLFVRLLRERLPAARPRSALDLGCGPCDVTRRFARAYSDCSVTAVDGARAMLAEGAERNRRAGLAHRIELVETRLPSPALAARRFDLVLSNSLLHHLPDPAILWQAIAETVGPLGLVFVMDLLRPASPEAALALVEAHAAGAPDVLRRDFHNSLRAAYRTDEVGGQLHAAGLGTLRVEAVSDRHWIA